MKLRKIQATVVAAVLLTAGVGILIPSPTTAAPNAVATTDAELTAYGRVFPDPQGCEAFGVPDEDGDGIKDTPEGVSPYAKGRLCAQVHLGYDETIAGVKFLQQKFPRFVQLIRLDEAYDNPNFKSAGLPQTFGLDSDGKPQILSRDRRPLYLFKITDAQSSIPEKERHHFAYSLSIHGIERAGLEGGVRALEDLVTWSACAYDANAAPACGVEGPFPKKIVETPTPAEVEVPVADDVLRRSVIYFVPPNPDGWRRGEIGEGGVYFQRYNGNGVDLNRDWPTIGYTYRPYSPGSEPETKAYAEVLKGLRNTTAKKKFTGGIDLHGQILAVAFSFTLLGASEKDFRKNFSTVDQSLRTWRDQTERLSWSPYIADANKNGQNDPGESCPVRSLVVTSGNFPYCFADQWGSVMDTIGYQITGGMGDWFESELGLGAVGLDNEMSMSHILPNTVYDPLNEQMHVDGNKGLIYSQLSSMLTEKDSDYEYKPSGKIGYVFDPRRLQVAADSRDQNPGFPAQNDINTLVPCEADCGGGKFVLEGVQPTLEFDVKGPDRGIFNGGITVEATFTNLQGVSTGSIPRLNLERFDEESGGQWRTAATSFVQAQSDVSSTPDLYLQGGQIVTVDDPVPGKWRVRLSSPHGSPARLNIDFRPVTAEENPGQAAIDVSSMDFFEDLNKYIPDGPKATPVTVDSILSNPDVLDQFDSLVVVDDFMPEFVAEGDERPFSGDPQPSILHTFPTEATVTGPDTFEFEVKGRPEADNDLMVVTSRWPVEGNHFNVMVEKRMPDGTWEHRGQNTAFINNNGERSIITTPEPGMWRIRPVRVLIPPGAPQPVDVSIVFSSDAAIPDPGQSKYTSAQFDQYTAALANFAADGGNLVLTDGALRGLAALGLVESDKIRSTQPGGRGAVPRYEMNVEGRGILCQPFMPNNSPDPLLKKVCLEGTAGGTARQAVEPVPIGYTPDATLDGSARLKLNQFHVNKAAWEAACGDPAKCTSATLGPRPFSPPGAPLISPDTGLGEAKLGSGVIRIAGALLPDPNFAPGGTRDMRFGLSSYALTFAGWQVFLNLVDYTRPPVDVGVSLADSPDPVFAGDVLTYTVDVSNNADQSAPGTQVTDRLPAGVSLVSASASQGTCSGTATVTCSLGRLAAKSSATVELQVRPSQPGTLTNTVSVSSDRADSNADNDSASESTTVQAPPAPDLSPSSITASRTTIRKGQNVVLTAAIQNLGSLDAENVKVQFKEGSTQIGTVQTISAIAEGGAETASVTWKPRTKGQRTITVIVDPANAIQEENETNNRLSKAFRVR